MGLKTNISAGYARIAAYFPEREFFMRSNGRVQFLKVSSRFQVAVAATALMLVLLLLIITITMAISQYTVSWERMALTEKEARVATSEERIAKYKESISDVAADLERRQRDLESSVGQYFPKLRAREDELENATPTDAKETLSKISQLVPEAEVLAKLEARQLAFVSILTREADRRAREAETAIRKLGLDPAVIARDFGPARGGPFVPVVGSDGQVEPLDPRFEILGRKLARMDALERGLAGVPSAEPVDMKNVSSGFGYRRDPFTGRGAMHNGLDFRGAFNQPIYSAAPGKISFAGWKSGYGRTVEIDHGNGLMTRYAHLASLKTRQGQQVTAGQHIGGMGSSGRSTGTHLHFEVRMHNRAINPKPFLEANRDVLTIQASAKQRTRPTGGE